MNNVEIIYYVLRGICVYCTSRGLRATISRKKSSSKIIFVDLFVNFVKKIIKNVAIFPFWQIVYFLKSNYFGSNFLKLRSAIHLDWGQSSFFHKNLGLIVSVVLNKKDINKQTHISVFEVHILLKRIILNIMFHAIMTILSSYNSIYI